MNNKEYGSKEIYTNSIYWDDIQRKPEEFTPEYHTHSEYAKRYHKHNASDILDMDAFADAKHTHDDRYFTKEEVEAIIQASQTECEINWEDIKGIPETFPSTEHTHHEHYYTRSEIDALLRQYALKEHRHTVDDIDGDFCTNPDGDHGGGSIITEEQAYVKFIIHPEHFKEDEYGLFYCQIEHGFETKNLDVITKDLDGTFVLVDINCLDANNIILTAMYDDAIILLAKPIAVE